MSKRRLEVALKEKPEEFVAAGRAEIYQAHD